MCDIRSTSDCNRTVHTRGLVSRLSSVETVYVHVPSLRSAGRSGFGSAGRVKREGGRHFSLIKFTPHARLYYYLVMGRIVI